MRSISRYLMALLAIAFLQQNIIAQSGNVGINQNSPASSLDVNGNLSIGSTYSGDSAAPTNGAIIEGKVGIGTTTPQNKLDVKGGIAIGSTYAGVIVAPTNGAVIQGQVNIGITAVPNSNKTNIAGSLAIGSGFAVFPAPSNEALIQGNVVIGVPYGPSNLTVGGNASIGPGYSTLSAPANGAIVQGYVGIGTPSPQAPLHVVGSSGNNNPDSDLIFFNIYLNNIASATNWQGSTCIYAQGNITTTDGIIAGASFNFSDARIKNIIGRSYGAEDLDRLNQIEITRYTHKDTIAKGSAVQTKVIAQQLEQVMPEAVSYTRGFIPDVMQVAERIDFQGNTLMVTLPKPHELKLGDHVKCMDEKGQELFLDVLAALKSQLSEMDTLKKQVAQLAASYPRTPVRGSHDIRQTGVRR
jgi:hypothetical protein